MPGDHFVADINDHGHDIDEDEWACCQDDEYKCTIIITHYCENDYYDDHDCWQNLYDRNELVDLIEETLRRETFSIAFS